MKNQNLRWIALVALPLCALACNKSTTEGAAPVAATEKTEKTEKTEAFGRLTVEQLETKLADAKAGKLALYVFDNNGKERFEKGHIPGAKWAKPDALMASEMPADKDATLVFYCANEHCDACHEGASAAIAMGYKKVFILPSGIAGWEKAQKPTERV